MGRSRVAVVIALEIVALLLAGSAAAAGTAGSAGVENAAPIDQGAGCGYPQYIIHLQPRQRNPLFGAVQTFVTQHRNQNRAAWYAPHVTVTGFFCPTSGIRTAIQAAIHDVRTPFGQPLVTGVSCNPGQEMGGPAEALITLHVDVFEGYQQFATNVAHRLHLGPAKSVGRYHMTLFQAENAATFPLATFDGICSSARQTFNHSALQTYNSSQGNHPYWRIALYRADQPVSSSYHLTNLLKAWQVNP